MLIPFNTVKVAQAAAVLLHLHEGRMSRLRLLKLLYIADRESLQQTHRPITGDRVAAMDHGPVLSHTYDLIKRSHYESPIWDKYITQRGPQDVELIDDPGLGKLSRYEIEKLTDVSERFRQHDDYDIAIETHKFPEWIKHQPPRGSSRPIPLADVLEAIGLKDEQGSLEAEAKADAELDHLLGSVQH